MLLTSAVEIPFFAQFKGAIVQTSFADDPQKHL